MATENNKIEFAQKKIHHNILIIYTKKTTINSNLSTKPSIINPNSPNASMILILDPDVKNLVDLSGLDDSKSTVNIYSIYDTSCSPIDVSEKIVATASGIMNDDLVDKEESSDSSQNLFDSMSNTSIIAPSSAKKLNFYDFSSVPTLFITSGSKSIQIDVNAIGEDSTIKEHEQNLLLCKEQSETSAINKLVSDLMFNMKSKEKGIIVHGTRLYLFYSNKKSKNNRSNVKSRTLPIILFNHVLSDVDLKVDGGNFIKFTIGKEKYIFAYDTKGIGFDKTAREINSIISSKNTVDNQTKALDFLSRLAISSLQKEEEQNSVSPFSSNTLKGLYNSTIAGASGTTRSMDINNLINPEQVNFTNISFRSQSYKPVKVYGLENSIYDLYKSQIRSTANSFLKILS